MTERTLRVRGGAKVDKLIGDEVANELELRGTNLVNIQTRSTVHWRLNFITMGGLCRVTSTARG